MTPITSGKIPDNDACDESGAELREAGMTPARAEALLSFFPALIPCMDREQGQSHE
jgi:hypothetical protein